MPMGVESEAVTSDAFSGVAVTFTLLKYVPLDALASTDAFSRMTAEAPGASGPMLLQSIVRLSGLTESGAGVAETNCRPEGRVSVTATGSRGPEPVLDTFICHCVIPPGDGRSGVTSTFTADTLL